MTDLTVRLSRRTVKRLPENWRVGRTCPRPGCGASADRIGGCLLEIGVDCPIDSPDMYAPTPYIFEFDRDCTDAAAEIRRLRAHIATIQGRHTYPSVEADQCAWCGRLCHMALKRRYDKVRAALELFEQQYNACGPNSNFGRIFSNVHKAACEALTPAIVKEGS